MSKTMQANALTIAPATAADREEIYRLRHEVYARELGQHAENDGGRLTDALDGGNHYICARRHGRVVGFVSLTPPGSVTYSVDKYVARDRLPFEFDDRLYEVRLLTVTPSTRGSRVAVLLMYAAFRWIEAHGGTRIVAIGRREVSRLYRKAGLLGTGIHVTSGAVTFEVLHATPSDLQASLARLEHMLARCESEVDWQLQLGFRRPAACFHGGAFFEAIGPRCDALDRRDQIINADVLDAWFPPSPRVTAALHEHLPWLVGTSPPNHAEGFVAAVAEARGVRPENVLPGAGSSSLIFLALRHWLTPASRVLVLDPMYAEYVHVLQQVIGCRVDRLVLRRSDGFRVSPAALAAALERDYDLVVLVNPNSPTGQHLSREALEAVLRHAPLRTRIWIDETYLEYVGSDESLERFAASSENVIISKSMSKVYALSGVRAAYLCAGAHQIEGLRPHSPPWAVSLPAQVAAINALDDPGYYVDRWKETHGLRRDLARALRSLGWSVADSCANFVLAFLPSGGPNAAEIVARGREHGLFLRDAAGMGTGLGDRSVRVAVKDAATQRRMIDILARVVGSSFQATSPSPTSRRQSPGNVHRPT